jgi:LytS/YehU family sensor histidine kinase
MQIDVQPGSLSFDLRNSKPVYTDNSLALNEYTGGIGVQNVKRRLEILYPQRHSLQIDEQPGSFHVSLQIKF